MDNFINLVERRVVKLVISVNILLVTEAPVVLIFITLNVYSDIVLLVFDNLAGCLVFYLRFLRFLSFFASDFDALVTKVDQCLNNIAVVVFDGLWHVRVHYEGAESEHESLHFEVLLDHLHFIDDL